MIAVEIRRKLKYLNYFDLFVCMQIKNIALQSKPCFFFFCSFFVSFMLVFVTFFLSQIILNELETVTNYLYVLYQFRLVCFWLFDDIQNHLFSNFVHPSSKQKKKTYWNSKTKRETGKGSRMKEEIIFFSFNIINKH